MDFKRLLSICIAASLAGGVLAQAPAESEDVVLQGFYWNSQKVTGWKQLPKYMDDMAKSFTCVWLPPSAAGEGDNKVGGMNVGYHPRQWTNQNSCWGTSDDLKSLITNFHEHKVKVIADMVVNHRAGNTSWGDFSLDDFGAYGKFQLTADHICRNDEMNFDNNAGSWKGKAKGANDTGENWGGARDLDHTSTYVQADVKAYMSWLMGEYGYDGWRYDFVKGFSPYYIDMYNSASKPYISVGEFWDGDYDKVWNWIKGTNYKSMAFDFPMKYSALNNGLAKNNFGAMCWQEDGKTWRPAGLAHHRQSNRYSMTFVDNHDTYNNNDNKFRGHVEKAYAFLMSSPGVPCVLWAHWTKYKKAIDSQIQARKAAGVHSQSDVEVTVHDRYYESVAKGKRGTLICRIGTAAPKEAPQGYFLFCEGGGWWYYLSDNLSGVENLAVEDNCWLTGNVLHVAAPAVVGIQVVAVSGQTVLQTRAAQLEQVLPAGVYVVKVGDRSYKFTVKA